jgi:hypothetical protein
MPDRSRHQPIQFSGDVRALATELRMPVGEVEASIDALIRAGHLRKISGTTYWLRPPAR